MTLPNDPLPALLALFGTIAVLFVAAAPDRVSRPHLDLAPLVKLSPRDAAPRDPMRCPPRPLKHAAILDWLDDDPAFSNCRLGIPSGATAELQLEILQNGRALVLDLTTDHLDAPAQTCLRRALARMRFPTRSGVHTLATFMLQASSRRWRYLPDSRAHSALRTVNPRDEPEPACP